MCRIHRRLALGISANAGATLARVLASSANRFLALARVKASAIGMSITGFKARTTRLAAWRISRVALSLAAISDASVYIRL